MSNQMRLVRLQAPPVSPPRTNEVTHDKGQAVVELALVLPVVCLMFLALIQVGLVVHSQLLVVHAAREGARAAAVDIRPGAAEAAVWGGTSLGADRTKVDVLTEGDRVVVKVRYQFEADLPLIGGLVKNRELSASATMQIEHDRP